MSRIWSEWTFHNVAIIEQTGRNTSAVFSLCYLLPPFVYVPAGLLVLPTALHTFNFYLKPTFPHRASGSFAVPKTRRTTQQTSRSNALWTQTTLLLPLPTNTREAAALRWRCKCEALNIFDFFLYICGVFVLKSQFYKLSIFWKELWRAMNSAQSVWSLVSLF